MKIAERLRYLRYEKGYSVSGIMAFIGVSKDELADYENGIVIPDRKTLRKLAYFFNVPVEYFLI